MDENSEPEKENQTVSSLSKRLENLQEVSENEEANVKQGNAKPQQTLQPEPPSKPPPKKTRRRTRVRPGIDDTRSMEEGKVGKDIRQSRTSLTAPPPAKTCFFYKDDDVTHKAIKLAINERKYKKFDTLLGELSRKLPGLGFGVRAIFTPEGKDRVESYDQLTSDNRYICSTNPYKVKGVDFKKVDRLEAWRLTRPPSGRRALNDLVRERQYRGRFGKIGKRDSAMANAYVNNMPKKVVAMKNGNPKSRHVMIFNRRTAQSFEQVLNDLGDVMKVAARSIYTIDGKPIRSLQQLFMGPDVIVVAGSEGFQEMSGFSPRDTITRQSRGGTDSVARRLQSRRERMRNTRGEWRIEVENHPNPATCTQAQVTITVYGHKGNSGPIALGTGDGKNFKSGTVDAFDISVGNIGEVYKIRIGHDNSGSHPGWFCNQVKMVDKHTKEELVFKCHRWMARDEDDGEICRELPAVRRLEPILPVVRYEVTVYTGDLWNASTEANVYMTVYGDRGDTGVRQLYKNLKGTKSFQQGQEETFTIEAVNLGHLRRVIVGHDGTGAGAGWFLDKIVIKEQNSKPHEENVFYCGRWLDEGEDDGKIVRELRIQEEYMDDVLEKKNWEIEKWKFEKDCQVKFYSVLTGKALRKKSNLSVDSLGDDTDTDAIFKVVPRKKTMVRMFSSRESPKNFLAIDNGRITMQGMGGPYCEFRVRVQSDRTVMLESVKNPLQFVTFNEDGYPADVRGILDKQPGRRFIVYCKGMFRHRGIIVFATSNTQAMNINEDHSLRGTGKQNSLARFRVYKVSTGGIRMFESIAEPGRFLRMKDGKIDCMGERDEFCHFIVERHREVGRVSLQSSVQRGLYVGMKPDGRVWPTVDTGVNNIFFYPIVLEFGVPKNLSTERVEQAALSAMSEQIDAEETITPRVEKEPTPKPKVEEGDWTIEIVTSEPLQKGTLALVVYGDQGNSGQIALGAPPGKEIFQAGNSDEFRANLKRLGNINKIRLELTPKRLDACWKVKQVSLENLTTFEVLKFVFNKWLSLERDDMELMREMPVTKDDQDVLPRMKYHVIVYTGKEEEAETDADVYLNIFGELGDTGKRRLVKSNSINKFRKGQVDVFVVEAVFLGPLQKCVVGHDSTKDGGGWYLEQIIVRESQDAKEEFVFPCERWLDTGQEDRKIERTLTLKELRPIIVVTEDEEEKAEEEESQKADTYRAGDWMVWTTTGSEESMGTTNDVIMYAYGSNSTVGPVTLGVGDGKDGYFKAGGTDEFKVFIGTDVGDIYKVRIGHNDKDSDKGWFLQAVKMKNMITGEEMTFTVNRWMSRSQDDGDVWREIPIPSKGKKAFPVETYTVEVYTGSGAETTAGVFICMFGERGDSGKRKLHKSQSPPFKEGAVDVFTLEAVSLGDIKKITIGQDGQGDHPGWFLDKIIIKDSNKTFYFPCNRLLDETQGDGKAEVEIQERAPRPKSEGEFKLWIKTCEDSFPPHEGSVYITAYGAEDKTDQIKLFAPNPTDKVFLPGNVDEFRVGVGEIGDLYKIRITRDETLKWKGWHIMEIKMQDTTTEEEFVFNCDRWMARDKDDFDLVREFPTSNSSLKALHYEVLVYVGNNWAAETDADVYITLFGQNGDSGRRLLYHSQTNSQRLQRGQVDTFVFEAVSLGDLTQVEIGHNSKGHGAGVFIDMVKVTEIDGINPNKEYVFPCRQWLDKRVGDGETWRTLPLIDVTDKTVGEKERNYSKKSKGKWNVSVKTSQLAGAGTHAQVSMTAFGSKGKSGKEILGWTDGESNVFGEGVISDFTVDLGDIGDLKKVCLEHDNSNENPSWHVDWMKLTDIDTDEEHIFYINRWFAKDVEDGLTFREFPVKRQGNSPLPEVQYLMYIKTGDYPEVSVNQGTAYFNLIGHEGETGERPLLNPYMGDNNLWQPGKTDVFLIETVSVGKITELQLQFEGKGKDKSWYVESVMIYEGFGAVSQTVFNCQRWIDTNNVLFDKFFVSEIRPSLCPPDAIKKWFSDFSPVQSNDQWSLWIYCGQQSDGGTTEDVYMIVYGLHGQTQPIHLNEVEKLKRGAVVKLNIDVGDIGAITKLQLFFGEDYTGSSWFLHRLKMKDNDTGDELNFLNDQDIEGTEENPNGMTELPAIRPDVVPLQEDMFTLFVATGTQERAGTEADVFCELLGDWGSSGKRLLRKSDNSTLFKQGQVDAFVINGLDLGNLHKIKIGHTEKGRGKGWFCDRVLVKSTLVPDLRIFPCNRWMDTGCEDRQLVRELSPVGEMPVAQAPGQIGGMWTCRVCTADRHRLPSEGHDLSVKSRAVSVVFYGSKGMEGPLELTNNDENCFLPGQINEFPNIDLNSIGNLEKIRVCSGYEEDPGSVWTVDKITLHGQDTEEQLHFDFSKYVGQINGDIRKESPIIKMGKGVKPVVPYHVEVYTSDEEINSGTKSNIFITLYGKNSDSGRRHLKNSSNKDKFKTGQIDLFSLEAVDLGELDKLVITKGPGDPWFLEKIIIKPGEYANTEYVFTFNQWIGEKDTEDREVEKILNRPTEQRSSVVKSYDLDEHVSKGVWKIQTETGGQKGEGPIRDIVIILSGDKGETTPAVLTSNKDNAFEIGLIDTCQVKFSEDVGDLYKVRLGFKDNTKNKGWYLRTITCEDEDTGDIFSYELNNWVIVDETSDGWKEFPVIWPAIKVPPVLTYLVSVHMGQVNKSESDVYINIHGDRGSTGPRILKQSLNNKNKFEAYKTDVFEVEAVSLGRLQKVTVGHEGHGAGSGWFLNKIVIQESDDAVEECVFRCNKWLDEGEEDNKIERTLFLASSNDPSPSPIPVLPVPDAGQNLSSEQGDTPKPKTSTPEEAKPEPEQEAEPVKDPEPEPEPVKPRTPTPTPTPPPGDPWKVTTVTGSEPGQGTVSAVVLVLYGDKGHSEQIFIGEAKEFNFAEGKTDDFEVRVNTDIGKLYKVRVGFSGEDHDISWYEDSATAFSWFLEKIILTDMTSNQNYIFIANQWIRVSNDVDFWKEFPLEDKDEQLPVKHYQVQVHTGNETDGETLANVKLEIVGERGDTGKRMLLKSLTNSSKFKQGATDLFVMEAVDLGKLTMVRVSHDGAKPGDGWYLQDIVIKETEESQEQYVFLCDKWLDAGKDDNRISRELPLTEVKKEPGEPWMISTVTGPEPGQGTKTPVVLVLYGDKGFSQAVVIGNKVDFSFVEGKKDDFKVKVYPDVGKLYKVRVGFHKSDNEMTWYQDSSVAPSWYLERLTMVEMDSGQEYTFITNQWIRLDGVADYWREFPVHTDNDAELLPIKCYQVFVHTGDRAKAGTNANVKLEIVGERGDTGYRMLLTSNKNTNKFEQGAVDQFVIEAVDLGKLTKVRVAHDGLDPGSGWFLEKVVVKETEESKEQHVFKCDKWLDKGEDDQLTSRELPLTEVVGEPVIPDGEPWEVCAVTGSEAGQGTGSPVSLVIYGNVGQSEMLVIGEDDDFIFAEGKSDKFQLYLEGVVGQVYKVRVGFQSSEHDWYKDISKAPSWFLSKMTLLDQTSNKSYMFECDQWINLDGKTDFWREFPVKEDNPENQLQARNYEVEVYTSAELEGGTNTNVHIQLFGERGDTGIRRLLTSKSNENKFEKGARDVFDVEAVDLGPLTKVVIGHDAGSGWFVDKVCIVNPLRTTEKYLFDCDRWLDTGSDTVLEREVPLTDVVDIVVTNSQTEPGPEKEPPKEGDFCVYVTTSSEEGSSTNAQVTLTVFGAGGNTGPLTLGEPNMGYFKDGQTDSFNIWLDLEDLGELSKIRLEHDDLKSGWRVDKLVLHDLLKDTKTEFDVNRWLSFEDEHGEISIEIPVSHSNRESWPVTSYIVEATTSDEEDAGTEANVYINLFGTLGDSGKRYLKRNMEGGTRFQKGQVNTFKIEAVDLGRLETIIVGHDGSGPEYKWLLDRVTVMETETAEKRYVFPCGSWLEDSSNLGAVEVELYMDRMENVPKPASPQQQENEPQPEGESQQPLGDSQQPEGGSQQPEGDSQEPEGNSQHPEGDLQQPEGDSQQTGNDLNKE